MINMPLSADEKIKLNELFEKQFGHTLEHTHLSNNSWTIATWDKTDLGYLHESPKLGEELDKIWREGGQTDRNTTVVPLQAEYGADNIVPISASRNVENLLTLAGMTHMAKKNTNEEPTLYTQYVAVGDDNTAPSTADIGLGNELDRKAWSSNVVLDQTEKYAGSFIRSDFGADVSLEEAGGFTNSSGVTCVFRVTFSPKTIGVGQIGTLQVGVSHKNGVVT